MGTILLIDDFLSELMIHKKGVISRCGESIRRIILEVAIITNMKNLPVKDLIDFRRRTDRGKRVFVDNIKSNKIEVPTEGGGNYWITSISAVSKSYSFDDINIVNTKIGELREKLSNTRHNITKDMYHRNISNLETYKGVNPKMIRPNGKLSFLKKSSANAVLTIKGLQIESKPSHIYTFGKQGEENVGAIWFTAKVDGFKIEEVGMFCDALYRLLKHNYSKKFEVASKYCVAIDVVSGHTVSYSQIEDGRVTQTLAPTLDEINSLI